jgi:hypothetical protein
MLFRHAPDASERKTQGEDIMKTTAVLAIALGLGALAACNKSPKEATADNIESNYENTADNMEASADNTATNVQDTASNAADAVRNEGQEKADAVRNSGNAATNNAE